MKKLFNIIWEYFPVYVMLIVIACMYIWEQKDMQANTPSQENCDIPVTPQLELIEYWVIKYVQRTSWLVIWQDMSMGYDGSVMCDENEHITHINIVKYKFSA